MKQHRFMLAMHTYRPSDLVIHLNLLTYCATHAERRQEGVYLIKGRQSLNKASVKTASHI